MADNVKTEPGRIIDGGSRPEAVASPMAARVSAR